jgi:CRISPR-associated protein Cas5d
MAFGFKLEAWGDFALFTRPEMSVERVTYDVPTPSAARGIVESIYWHPGMHIVIDKIHVLNPIKFTSVRRNEVKSKATASDMRKAMTDSLKNNKVVLPGINAKDDIVQRASLILMNVRYVIEFHFEMTSKASDSDNPAKFAEIFRRRISRGQFYSQPYFGCREFPANFRAWPEGKSIAGYYSDRDPKDRNLGFMLYDMDYSNPQDIVPMFFRAHMVGGTIDVAGSEVYR